MECSPSESEFRLHESKYGRLPAIPSARRTSHLLLPKSMSELSFDGVLTHSNRELHAKAMAKHADGRDGEDGDVQAPASRPPSARPTSSHKPNRYDEFSAKDREELVELCHELLCEIDPTHPRYLPVPLHKDLHKMSLAYALLLLREVAGNRPEAQALTGVPPGHPVDMPAVVEKLDATVLGGVVSMLREGGIQKRSGQRYEFVGMSDEERVSILKRVYQGKPGNKHRVNCSLSSETRSRLYDHLSGKWQQLGAQSSIVNKKDSKKVPPRPNSRSPSPSKSRPRTAPSRRPPHPALDTGSLSSRMSNVSTGTGKLSYQGSRKSRYDDDLNPDSCRLTDVNLRVYVHTVDQGCQWEDPEPEAATKVDASCQWSDDEDEIERQRLVTEQEFQERLKQALEGMTMKAESADFECQCDILTGSTTQPDLTEYPAGPLEPAAVAMYSDQVHAILTEAASAMTHTDTEYPSAVSHSSEDIADDLAAARETLDELMQSLQEYLSDKELVGGPGTSIALHDGAAPIEWIQKIMDQVQKDFGILDSTWHHIHSSGGCGGWHALADACKAARVGTAGSAAAATGDDTVNRDAAGCDSDVGRLVPGRSLLEPFPEDVSGPRPSPLTSAASLLSLLDASGRRSVGACSDIFVSQLGPKALLQALQALPKASTPPQAADPPEPPPESAAQSPAPDTSSAPAAAATQVVAKRSKTSPGKVGDKTASSSGGEVAAEAAVPRSQSAANLQIHAAASTSTDTGASGTSGGPIGEGTEGEPGSDPAALRSQDPPVQHSNDRPPSFSRPSSANDLSGLRAKSRLSKATAGPDLAVVLQSAASLQQPPTAAATTTTTTAEDIGTAAVSQHPLGPLSQSLSTLQHALSSCTQYLTTSELLLVVHQQEPAFMRGAVQPDSGAATGTAQADQPAPQQASVPPSECFRSKHLLSRLVTEVHNVHSHVKVSLGTVLKTMAKLADLQDAAQSAADTTQETDSSAMARVKKLFKQLHALTACLMDSIRQLHTLAVTPGRVVIDNKALTGVAAMLNAINALQQALVDLQKVPGDAQGTEGATDPGALAGVGESRDGKRQVMVWSLQPILQSCTLHAGMWWQIWVAGVAAIWAEAQQAAAMDWQSSECLALAQAELMLTHLADIQELADKNGTERGLLRVLCNSLETQVKEAQDPAVASRGVAVVSRVSVGLDPMPPAAPVAEKGCCC